VIVCVRHGETEWSRSGQHTGRTDIPLTQAGREQALMAGRRIAEREFALVLTSPLERAHETARLAGLDAVAQVDEDLMEWDYGECESRTSEQIREEHPGWNIWSDGCAGGEDLAQVAARADRVIERIAAVEGDVALFSHGHFLRVLGARWVGQSADLGERLTLDTAAVCELDTKRGVRVIARWNMPRDTPSARGASEST
jgi:broad specificity phosphatase PhoE